MNFRSKYLGILRKVRLFRVKEFKFLLQDKDFEITFPVNKFDNSFFLFFQAIIKLKIPFVNFRMNLFENTTHRFLNNIFINTIRNVNNLQSVSSGILGVFPALQVWCLQSSFDISGICDPIIASVFRSSCISSGLVSLFSTASAWTIHCHEQVIISD